MNAVTENITILPMSRFNNPTLNSLKANFKSFKKSKKILMIEDDPDMAAVISKSLKQKYSCIIDIAQDPFEAMNFMTENFYDLIILDWQLPALNGAETLVQAEKGLRLEPSLPIQWDRQRVPVVIFSSSKKNECPPRRTKHFNYVGFVSKSQPLNAILDSFGHYMEDETTYRYGTA
ncbi:MAG: response regulator [Bdellovibrionaceae bacterium]|nr:response regulator [Bdellovibrio sp.]